MNRKSGGKLLVELAIPVVFVALGCVVLFTDDAPRPVGVVCAVLATLYWFFWGWAKVRALRHAEMRLSQARTAAERLARGHFDRLPEETDENVSDITEAFNAMVEAYERRENGLRDQALALTVVNQRMEAVLDATNDGLALLSREGLFMHVNRRFCEMLGTRKDTLLLESVDAVRTIIEQRFVSPDRLIAALTMAADSNPDSFGVKEDVVELAREHVFLQVYSAPVRGDNREVNGRIIALHDITREKELDKLKTEFISVVSHELRTPLTSIKGYTDLMISGQTGEINEIQQEFLGIVQASANRLGNLINDILDISRIEAGRLDMRSEPVDYAKILGDVLRLMKAAADEKDIILDASFPEEWPIVRGDPDKIGQIVTNLLSNAIKYTPAGGFVKVHIDTTVDGVITTCVADTGIGISEEDQKKLFQKFFRADNSLTREAGGTGLGLVIVKTMVEMLGGTIWVESEPGQGSRFYFTLPVYDQVSAVADENAAAHAAGIPEPIDRGLGLVLIVEDDSYSRDLLQHVLHRRGYGVVSAADVDESVQKARRLRPNVVLLDMMLPHMASFQVLRCMHADGASTRIPVIAYSLAGDPYGGQMALGAFSFMRKPVDYAALAETLKAHVGGGRQPALLMIACGAQEGDAEVAGVRQRIEAAGAQCDLATTSSEAIARVIGDRVDAVLIDIDCGEEEMLFDLMRALKSEEDIARIPLILVTRNLAKNDLHYHLGSGGGDTAANLEYLAEQVARVMRGDDPAPANTSCEEK